MRCYHGSSSGPISCCCGWRIRSYATNGLAVPTRDAAPPAAKAGWSRHPKAVVVVLVARGELRLVLTITERDYVWDECDVGLSVVVDGGSMRLYGSGAYVFDEGNARHFLIAVRPEDTEDVGLIVVPADAADIPAAGCWASPGT